jgi:hypothetical protein
MRKITQVAVCNFQFLQMEFWCKKLSIKKTKASKAAIRFPMIGFFLFYENKTK